MITKENYNTDGETNDKMDGEFTIMMGHEPVPVGGLPEARCRICEAHTHGWPSELPHEADCPYNRAHNDFHKSSYRWYIDTQEWKRAEEKRAADQESDR